MPYSCVKPTLIAPVPAFPDDPELGVRRTKFHLSRADLFEIFEPVIQEVRSLVTKQIEDTRAAGSKVRTIVMVGGFGESTYLRNSLLDLVNGQEIKVWRVPQGYVRHQL